MSTRARCRAPGFWAWAVCVCQLVGCSTTTPAPAPAPAPAELRLPRVDTSGDDTRAAAPPKPLVAPAAVTSSDAAVPPSSGAGGGSAVSRQRSDGATPAVPQAPTVAAVEARFPDPAPGVDGPAAADLGDLPPAGPAANADLRHQLRALVNDEVAGHAAPTVALQPLGRSQHGAPLEALVITDGSDATPFGLSTTGKPTVLLVAGQHGDEPAGPAALLVVARQLANGTLRGLLDHINVVIVASANPDGAAAGTLATADGTDADGDHLLLRTPETQALARLRRDVDPAVVADLHEYPVAAERYAAFGGLPRADLQLQTATTANVAPFIAKAAEEWFRAPVAKALPQAGYTVDWSSAPAADGDRRMTMGDTHPVALHNLIGLTHGIGLLLASRGSDLGALHWRRRVHTQVLAVTAVLRSAAAHAVDLGRLRSFVAGDVAAQACTGTLVIDTAPTPSEYTVQLLDPVTGADRPVAVAWDSVLALRTTRSRPRPCGYWLAAGASTAVERLRLQGVRVRQVGEAGELRGEMYVDKPVRPASGGASGATGATDSPLTVGPPRPPSMGTAAMLLDVPAGSYYVGLDQALANLIAALLEPDTAQSAAANGLIGRLDDVARVLLRPAVALTTLP